ncbi:MAG: TfoX/Sxy family protein, partial [Pseudomonadota bacterium]
MRQAVDARPYTAEKKMFGGLAFMLNDYMVCGVTDERLMARVGPAN